MALVTLADGSKVHVPGTVVQVLGLVAKSAWIETGDGGLLRSSSVVMVGPDDRPVAPVVAIDAPRKGRPPKDRSAQN